jgi:hypothetical protein
VQGSEDDGPNVYDDDGMSLSWRAWRGLTLALFVLLSPLLSIL